MEFKIITNPQAKLNCHYVFFQLGHWFRNVSFWQIIMMSYLPKWYSVDTLYLLDLSSPYSRVNNTLISYILFSARMYYFTESLPPKPFGFVTVADQSRGLFNVLPWGIISLNAKVPISTTHFLSSFTLPCIKSLYFPFFKSWFRIERKI